MKKILVTLLVLLVLGTSCTALGLPSSDPGLKIGSTGTVTGTIKDTSFYSGSIGCSVTLTFTPVGTAKSVSWSFDYSGETTVLADLMLIKAGDTVTITYKRIEAYPQDWILPTKDITGLIVNGGTK